MDADTSPIAPLVLPGHLMNEKIAAPAARSTQHISEVALPLLGELLDRHSAGDEVSYDIGYNIMQTPQGSQVIALVIVTIKSLVLGSPPLLAADAVSISAITDREQMDRIVLRLLGILRENRDRQLRDSAPPDMTRLSG